MEAFEADPSLRWVYPERDQYLSQFPDFVWHFGGKAFECGTADRLDSRGAALWLPPGVEPDGNALDALVESTIREPTRSHLLSIFEQMSQFHPNEAHWYLALMGVGTLHQGQGLGSLLLEQGLGRCDRAGYPAYLESSNPRNIPFYERHGFKVIGRIQAGESPDIIPMLRLPK
jgi:GNAT superfamily N-acetyltransferase